VVIDDLDIVGIAISPHEADPRAVVDAYRVLTRAISRTFLETVPWRCAKVLDRLCGIDHRELPLGDSLDLHREPRHPLSGEHARRVPIAEGPDHSLRW